MNEWTGSEKGEGLGASTRHFCAGKGWERWGEAKMGGGGAIPRVIQSQKQAEMLPLDPSPLLYLKVQNRLFESAPEILLVQI